MTDRYPIALVGGLPREIPSTDRVKGDASIMSVTETGGVPKTMADAFAGKLSTSGGTMTGPLVANSSETNKSFGYVGMYSGTNTNTGYIRLIQQDGTRAGYIGYASSSDKQITMLAENGYVWNFNGPNPTVNGNAIWHGGNLNPANFAPIDNPIFGGAPNFGQALLGQQTDAPYMYSNGGNSVSFRVGPSSSFSYISLDGTGISYNGNLAWHGGNFKPSGVIIDAYNEFGVRADGTDQTAKIKNALAKATLSVDYSRGGYGGGTVVLPWGVIIVTDTIVVPSCCGLGGQGPTQTCLEMTADKQDRAIIQVSRGNDFARVSDIGVRFAGSTPGVEAATGFLINANYGMYTNIHANNTSNAFAVRGGNNNLITQYFGAGFSLAGIINEGTTEVQADGSWRGAIDNFFVSGRLQNISNKAFAQNGTVRLVNNCEGFNLNHLSCLGGKYGLVVEAADNVHGHRPQFMTISDCMFDSHVQGSQLNACNQSRFSNVWFAGAGAYDGAGGNAEHGAYDGVVIGAGCFDLTFMGGWSNNNAGAGMSIVNGARGIHVSGMTLQNNGIYGRAWGIELDGQMCQILGNKFFKALPGGPGGGNLQQVSLVMRANAANCVIALNVSDHAAALGGTNNQVANNIGF